MNRSSCSQLVFRCVICKDFEYNKVMPTFHNWSTRGSRLGLIFQTAADGRVFDRGIMGIMVELSAGKFHDFLYSVRLSLRIYVFGIIIIIIIIIMNNMIAFNLQG